MQNRFQSLRIIVAALGIGQLAFLAVAQFIQRSVVPPESLDPTILPVVGAIVLMASVAASVQLGRLLAARSAQQSDETSRWSAFQSAVIVRLAFLEGASFMQIVCYMLTGEWIFLVFFAVSFGTFVYQRPAEDEWEKVRKGA